jgi:hypothetical protein
VSIVQLPANIKSNRSCLCALCAKSLSLADATLGPTGANGNSAIICDDHLIDERRFIRLMADYSALLNGSNALGNLTHRGHS